MALRDGLDRVRMGLRARGSRQVFSARLEAVDAAWMEREPEALLPFLQDRLPGVRRASARRLGWLESAPAQLIEALRSERTDTVVTALAGAALRAGVPPEDVIAQVDRHRARAFATTRGERCPARIPGTDLGRLPLSIWWEVGRLDAGPALRREEVLDQWLGGSPPSREHLPILACQGGEQAERALERLGQAAGRRLGHAWLDALGWSGSPRWESTLRDALRAIDRDPSHALATRRAAAGGLGRLGSEAAVPALLRALRAERLDHEGRPGAGLGIQFPTRSAIVWALGEIGSIQAAPALIELLDDTSGAATGALDIAAADALWKLGPGVEDPLRQKCSSPQADVALLARSILGEPRS